MPTYYAIDEAKAKAAKNMNSHYDYIEGSATANYRRMVDRAAGIAEAQKARVPEEYHPKIDSLLDRYAHKLADNLNHRYSIDCRVPSILVAGGVGINPEAKRRQNAAREANEADYLEIEAIVDRIRSVGTGGIMSDDKDAITKLTAKLEKMDALQAKMRSVNAYYRKHKSLDGCPDLTEAEIDDLSAAMKKDVLYSDIPFAPYALSNNNANIRRTKERIAELEKEQQRAAEGTAEEITGDGYTLKENPSIGRIQFVFDGKPEAHIRELLKAHGFRWAPSEGAWQRLLNDNGRTAAHEIIGILKEARA